MTEFRFRPCGPAIAVAVLGSILAGCSSITTPSFSSLFGSSSAAGNANASAESTLPPNFECPDVTIRQGAATLTSSANPAEPAATNLRYQVTFGTTARECRMVQNMLSIKVGVQGRVILGPEGSPGEINVPIRFAVVREGLNPKPIVTKLERISVVVPPDDSNVLFSHVEEGLVFPMPKGGEIDSYVVYVGFDPIGAQELEKKKPAPKPARPHRRTS
jgi:hypothetical protein